MDGAGKKTAAAIHQEVAREVNQLLGRIFAQRRKDGRTDLEAVESALRTALHQAGAGALSELLQFEIPEADQRQLPCRCGHQAQYQEIRCKLILTIVGAVRIARPYYLCYDEICPSHVGRRIGAKKQNRALINGRSARSSRSITSRTCLAKSF